MGEINTIEVSSKPISSTETLSALEIALRDIGIENARAFSTQVYTFGGEMSKEELEKAAELVYHHVTQDASINKELEKQGWDFAIKIDYKPGVTDNAARVLNKDMELVEIKGKDVYTSAIHYISGEFNEGLRELLERVSSNPQIHDIRMLTKEEFEKNKGFERKIHPVILPDNPSVFNINLEEMTKEELLRTGKQGTLNLDLVKEGMTQKQIDGLRGGTLALAEDYMDAILKYSLSDLNVRNKGVVTDTELEVLAQMWSEHCRHSLYNAAIPESEDGIFKTYIKNPSEEVLKEKPHLGVSIYKDNSGVFKFNDKWLILIKNETHNSPSALDPYGGAITGIVGVIRDPLGTGKGGEVIANFLFYYLGHKDDKSRYFKIKKESGALEELLLNPKQIFDGVVKGVEEGANQMGIALNQGICQFHDRYNGKPIVGVGSIGRMPIEINGEPSHTKHIDEGDRLYVIGGRAGKDGIHGATFSSEALSANSPATAVQIGDAYTERKMSEAIKELRDMGYIKFITDLGAGGVCCASMEMAEQTNGLDIDLDKLLIKYKGMTATELFLNESQERMALAVDEKNKEKIEEILKKHEVEFSDIGIFTNSGRAVVRCKNETVVNLDMDFVNNGYPKRILNPKEYRMPKEKIKELEQEFENGITRKMAKCGNYPEFLAEEFYEMLSRPNLGSVAEITDKMDSTVKGLSVQHCIQGRGRISTKASCILPDIESNEGLIQAYGHSERQSYIDSEKMGKNAFLRSIGNNIAMGGRLDYMVATDQALWQSSDEPEYQQMLIEANRGMASVITGCKIPVISGKDSMYNQAKVYDSEGNVVKRGVFPTILMTTVSKIDNVADIVTVDAKKEGDLVYVVGAETKADLGGSEYMNMHSEKAGVEYNVGRVSDENVNDVFDTFQRMNNARNILQSAKYIESGGLMTAVKETAIAGELGIDFDITGVKQQEGLEIHETLYSETEGRFVVTINPKDKSEFEKMFSGKYGLIGTVTGKNLVMRAIGATLFSQPIKLFSEPIKQMLEMYHRAA